MYNNSIIVSNDMKRIEKDLHISGAGGKVRGWLNGIEISRVSRKIYTRTRA